MTAKKGVYANFPPFASIDRESRRRVGFEPVPQNSTAMSAGTTPEYPIWACVLAGVDLRLCSVDEIVSIAVEMSGGDPDIVTPRVAHC